MDNVRSELRSNKLSVDRQEQWSRRNAIRIRGLNEHRDENTLGLVHKVCSDIGVALCPGDISTTHRTGKRRQARSKDVIVLFTQREIKYRVMRAKNKLRGINWEQ